MKNISEIDKNFKVESNIKRENLQFRDAETEPFRIYGLLRENGRFCRIPEAVNGQSLHSDIRGNGRSRKNAAFPPDRERRF